MAWTIHVVPKAPAQYCVRCEHLIVERWDPNEPLCANCVLEKELFDRESRLG
jgi:hypothetical protein